MKKYILILLLLIFPASTYYASNNISKPKKPKYTAKDIYIVASVIWNESRGESHYGKCAVASVIYNRSEGDVSKFSKVIRQDDWLGKPYEEIKIYDSMSEEIKLAKYMFDNKFSPISNYTHFYNPKISNPDWKYDLINKKKIGNHVFGKIKLDL